MSDNAKKVSAENNSTPKRDYSYRLDLILIGIVLPIITLAFEMGVGFCSQVYIDPIPTVWHVLLVAFVPLANIYLLWSLWKGNLERTKLFGWASAIAVGVGIFYSLLFVPVSPLSIIGIFLYGLGLLGLSPMLALLGTLLMRRYYLQSVETKEFSLGWRGLLVGFLVAVLVIGISESSFLITRHGLELASSSNVEEQNRGLDILRKYGNVQYMQEFENGFRGGLAGGSPYISGLIYSTLFSTKNIRDIRADEIYYRLHGKKLGNNQSRGWLFPERNFDRNSRRSRLRKNLFLTSSEMEGSIDNDASLGYLEWTIKFRNDNEWGQREAVGQIQLPADAVVSRLTLWVNGEEREAAFAERNKVTKAYEDVVRTKRDPVLVTTAGRDRVDMKCFPVMPKGGEMKVRIGITFPLALEDKKSGLLRLPYFRSKNFMVSDSTNHKISMLSTKELESANKNLKFTPDGRFFVMSGEVSNDEIVKTNSTIRALRSDEKSLVWAKYDNSFIKQEIVEIDEEKPARFVFAIDTSLAMKDEKENIVSVIKKLPTDTEVGLVLTHGNALNREIAYPNSFVGKPSEVAEKIKAAKFGGGTDNLPSLTKAWDLANEVENGVVIWLHAPQPFKFSNSKDLAKRLIRRTNKTEIYSFSIANGFDEIEKELYDLNFLKNAPRFNDLQTDVERLVLRLNKSKRSFGYARTIDNYAKETVEKKTSKHMIRLWAFNEINEILASEKDEKSAIELATKYQLVTPVTGAVVLETQEQYDRAGLKPVEKNVVHAVPEPETYVLMLIGLIFILWIFKKQGASLGR